jgi:formate dehydrogenase major subunit
LFGANITECYPPVARWIKIAKDKGVQIVYLDPRCTNTCVFSNIFLRPRPGSDGALILGLLNYLISNNLYNKDFVASSVKDFDMVVESVQDYTLDRVSEITWMQKDDIRKLAEMLGRSRKTIFWMGGALSRYTNGIQTARALVALQAVTGNLAGKGKGILAVQAGKPGGDEHFSKTYSNHDMIYKLGFRKMLYAMKRDKISVLLLTSSFRRYPDSDDLREAIKKVDFIIHRGFFMNEEAKLSHLFIPGVMNYESEGSMYGLQRQVVWRNKVIEPLGETVSEFDFYRDLGQLLCGDAFPPAKTPEDMYTLMQKTDPSWAGLALERVKNNPSGIVWPCYSTDGTDGRGTLFKDGRFWTKSGKVEFKIPGLGNLQWKEPKGSPGDKKKGNPEKFPLIFTQGKVVQHWQHSITSWSRYMAQFSNGNVTKINPVTAHELDLAEGDRAWLETEVGRIRVRINVTDDVMPGVVWTPSYPDPASTVAGNAGQTINSIVPGYWDKQAAQFNGFGCCLTKA